MPPHGTGPGCLESGPGKLMVLSFLPCPSIAHGAVGTTLLKCTSALFLHLSVPPWRSEGKNPNLGIEMKEGNLESLQVVTQSVIAQRGKEGFRDLEKKAKLRGELYSTQERD